MRGSGVPGRAQARHRGAHVQAGETSSLRASGEAWGARGVHGKESPWILLDFHTVRKYYESMKRKRKKMGRPPRPPAEKQGERITVYLTKAERKRLEALAKVEGLSLASLVMRPWRKEGN